MPVSFLSSAVCLHPHSIPYIRFVFKTGMCDEGSARSDKGRENRKCLEIMVFVSVNVKMIRVCGGDNCYIWVKVVERPVVFVCLDDRQRRLFVQDKIAPRVSEYSPQKGCASRIGVAEDVGDHR